MGETEGEDSRPAATPLNLFLLKRQSACSSRPTSSLEKKMSYENTFFIRSPAGQCHALLRWRKPKIEADDLALASGSFPHNCRMRQ